MKILIADDDQSIRRLLTKMVPEWGYEPIDVGDGAAAWAVMGSDDPPMLGIIDWNMPRMTGPEVIRKVRSRPLPIPPYLLLLTAKDKQRDIVEGLRAGANDYITKPFDYDELQARLLVGAQNVCLQGELAQKVEALQESLEQVHRLQGLLPICGYCKKIRDDKNYWHGVEEYISSCSEAVFSHGVCPDCFQTIMKPAAERARRRS